VGSASRSPASPAALDGELVELFLAVGEAIEQAQRRLQARRHRRPWHASRADRGAWVNASPRPEQFYHSPSARPARRRRPRPRAHNTRSFRSTPRRLDRRNLRAGVQGTAISDHNNGASTLTVYPAWQHPLTAAQDTINSGTTSPAASPPCGAELLFREGLDLACK